MPETIDIVASGKMIEVRITGKLTKEAYEKLVPVVDQQIKEFGKLRFLVILEDFHGWTLSAIWEDTKFDLQHWRDIEKLAIVGETKWEEGMSVFCKPFTSAKIKYFDHAKLDEARTWIAE